MNPQVIIELLAAGMQAGLSPQESLRDWQQLPDVEAVRNGRVYQVDDDYAFIPGPRFILLVEEFARLIHPEFQNDTPIRGITKTRKNEGTKEDEK
jgi:iron complex transport system substrate-binding protein